MNLLFLTESYLAGVTLDYYRQGITDALCRLGYTVQVLKVNVPGVDKDYVHQVCNRFNPEVVFSINAAGIALLPPALKADRLIWFIDSYERMKPDWLPFFQHSGHVFLTGINRYYDRFLELFPMLENRLHIVPFGAGIQMPTVTNWASKPTDVLFVGTAFGGSRVTEGLSGILAALPDMDRQQACNHIVHHQQYYDFDIGQKLKAFSESTTLDNLTADKKVVRLDEFDYRCRVDDALSVQKRLRYLSALAGYNLLIYGDSNEGWASQILLYDAALLTRFQFRPIINPNQLAEQYSQSKISLNIQHHQAFDFGLSWRVFDIFACGSLLLTEGLSRQPLNMLGFEENRDYVAFDTTEDLQAKVKHYLSAPDEAMSIIRSAKQKVETAHELFNRVETLIKTAGLPVAYTSDYCAAVFCKEPNRPCLQMKVPSKKHAQTPAFHFKTRLGSKYYLKLEVMKQ